MDKFLSQNKLCKFSRNRQTKDEFVLKSIFNISEYVIILSFTNKKKKKKCKSSTYKK